MREFVVLKHPSELPKAKVLHLILETEFKNTSQIQKWWEIGHGEYDKKLNFFITTLDFRGNSWDDFLNGLTYLLRLNAYKITIRLEGYDYDYVFWTKLTFPVALNSIDEFLLNVK